MGSCRLSIGDGVDNLGLRAGELSSTLEVLERLGNLALLQEQLGHGSNRNVALRVNCVAVSMDIPSSPLATHELTNQSLLAELLGLLEVMLPLEQGKGLVDQGKDIDAHRLALLLHLDGLVKLLDGFGEVLLVKEQFSVVVVDVRHILEVLHGASERSHRRCNRAHLVLRNTELNVREDECPVKVDRLLIILGSFSEFTEDEVELGTVVVDVRVVLVVSNSKLEVVLGCVLVAYCPLDMYQQHKKS